MEQQGLAKDIACYHGVVSLMASQIGHYEDVVRVPAGRRSATCLCGYTLPYYIDGIYPI